MYIQHEETKYLGNRSAEYKDFFFFLAVEQKLKHVTVSRLKDRNFQLNKIIGNTILKLGRGRIYI